MKEINSIIKPIYQQKCVHISRWQGTMLLIDFGEYHDPQKGRKFGSYDWSLSIDDCSWELSQDRNLIVGNGDSETKIEKEIQLLVGKYIQNIEISEDFAETKFYFNKNILLYCKHKPSNKYEDWSLQTPDNNFLEIGPKHKWRYLPGSDTTNW